MKADYGSWFGRVDYAALLDDLRDRRVNYAPEEVNEAAWNFDSRSTTLPREQPGSPEPGGPWEIACRLVEMYEPAEPAIIRGVFRHASPLQGRDMLLEGRFHGLHFHMGVRVTSVIDERRDDGTRVWGWGYETLEGHLERGRMTYEVIKDEQSGEVRFVTRGVSQRAPTIGPVVTLGWILFGRRTQLRFYRGCADRMLRMVSEIHAGTRPMPSPVVLQGLVHAPSDAKPLRRDKLAARREQPG